MSSTKGFCLEKMESEKKVHSLPLVVNENGNTIISMQIQVNNRSTTSELSSIQPYINKIKLLTEKTLAENDKVTMLPLHCKLQPVRKKVIVKARMRKRKNPVMSPNATES